MRILAIIILAALCLTCRHESPENKVKKVKIEKVIIDQ